jgi:hypothetical protein
LSDAWNLQSAASIAVAMGLPRGPFSGEYVRHYACVTSGCKISGIF